MALGEYGRARAKKGCFTFAISFQNIHLPNFVLRSDHLCTCTRSEKMSVPVPYPKGVGPISHLHPTAGLVI